MNFAEGGTVIFDTDVLIWGQKGNKKAIELITSSELLQVSAQSYMEILQQVRDRRELQKVKSFLRDFEFMVLPLTERIGHRACVYIEQYALSHGLRAGDALIAATAAENRLPLVSANRKHYHYIQELDFRVFSP
jgi:predicted nucleic acid-binding protein